MDQRTRKLMTMHKALHPKDDIDRLYMSRKKEGRALASTKDIVEVSIQRFKDFMHDLGGRLIKAIKNHTVINSQKTKKGRKTTVCTFQVTNQTKSHRENLEIAKKGKR